jgi:hypothetical protein
MGGQRAQRAKSLKAPLSVGAGPHAGRDLLASTVVVGGGGDGARAARGVWGARVARRRVGGKWLQGRGAAVGGRERGGGRGGRGGRRVLRRRGGGGGRASPRGSRRACTQVPRRARAAIGAAPTHEASFADRHHAAWARRGAERYARGLRARAGGRRGRRGRSGARRGRAWQRPRAPAGRGGNGSNCPDCGWLRRGGDARSFVFVARSYFLVARRRQFSAPDAVRAPRPACRAKRPARASSLEPLLSGHARAGRRRGRGLRWSH